MHFKNFVDFKKNEFYGLSISKNYIKNFFTKSSLHYAICLEISCETNNGGISYEEICSKIPNLIGSRTSIQTVLNDGVSFNCFEKLQHKLDKRVKKYVLSKDFSIMVTDWFISQKEFFS